MAGERGNIFFMIFVAVALVGLLTIVVRGTLPGHETVTKEDLLIEAGNTARYGAELASAVDFVLKNGASETQLRFSPPSSGAAEYGAISTTPSFQIFSRSGGNAEYRSAPARIFASGSAAAWEFYGTTAIPDVGSDRAELVAVLPGVSADFCAAVNTSLGLTGQPDDAVTGASPDCVESGASSRFGAAVQFDTTPNTMDAASFSKKPMMQGCVTCGANYHYFYVLMSR